jgi:hypothetical protein
MSERTIFDAPATETVEEVVPKLTLGNTVAASIPMMIMTTTSSIRVNPEGFKGPRGRGSEGLLMLRLLKAEKEQTKC